MLKEQTKELPGHEEFGSAPKVVEANTMAEIRE
jgi:hypothetical protein